MRKFIFGLATTAVLTAVVALALTVGLRPQFGGAADHLDAPLVATDGRIDINDVYVFHPGATQDLSRTVLAVTVDPGAGVLSPTTFHPDADYDFKIDTDGDAVEDLVFRAQFSEIRGDGTQRVKIRMIEGDDIEKGGNGRNLINGRTGQTIEKRDVSLFAGVRDDPFFFDLANFRTGLTFCGAGSAVSDFFLGLNVAAIVLEVPTSMLGSSSNIGVWATTSLPEDEEEDSDEEMVQIDRMGRPAINTVFIPPNPLEPAEPSQKDAFNAGHPADDQADFRAEVVDTLLAIGNPAARANALADVLLPDILTIDTSQASGFLNGRNLADDVIDGELALLTDIDGPGGNPPAIPMDCVANDSTFLSDFPYLGVPNVMP